MLVDRRPHLHFLDLDGLGLLARITQPPLLLVDHFFVIDDLADGGLRFWCNFHQIKLGFLGQTHGFRYRNNAQLLVVLVDQAYFSRPDFAVNPIVLPDTASPPV
jgi:hypothetical protein